MKRDISAYEGKTFNYEFIDEAQFIKNHTTAAAIIMCFIWVGIWWGITSTEGIYDAVIYPIWAVVLMAAIIYLIITIKQFFDNCNKYWEVRLNEIGYRKC